MGKKLVKLHAAAKAYDDELNRLGIPPNGDDYNALYVLIATMGETGRLANLPKPVRKGR